MKAMQADFAQARPIRLRGLIAIGLLVLCLLLLLNLSNVLHLAGIALGYPFDMDYGEGIVWQQMRDIVAGKGYAPLGVFPAIVYHYPPVYHLTVSAVATVFNLDQLLAGRLVSIVSTFSMACAIGLLSSDIAGKGTPRTNRLIGGGIAGLAVLACNPVFSWATLMRVDMLCAALSLSGLLLAARSNQRPALTFCAGIAFTLAIFTKQTAIAAPTAAFLALLIAAPRNAFRLASAAILPGLIALGWLIWSTNVGFIRHTMLYNVNRLDLTHLSRVIQELQGFLPIIIIGMMGAAAAWRKLANAGVSLNDMTLTRHILHTDRSAFAALMLLIYLFITTLMVPMILKSGANINYLIEWICALTIFTGFAAQPMVAFLRTGEGRTPALISVMFVIFLSLQIYAATRWDGARIAHNMEKYRVRFEKIVKIVRLSPLPAISDDMTVLIRAGQPVRWEPAIAAELGSAGIYDERQFAKMIRAHRFSMFFTQSHRGDPTYDARYNPVIADAIDEAYPNQYVFGKYVLHLPEQAKH